MADKHSTVLKTEGTVFSYMDQPRLVNNFIFSCSKAQFKPQTSHVLNLMLMGKTYCSCSSALDLARVKFTFEPGLILRFAKIILNGYT